jgi:poly-D-alanine transfer protein DltD
LPPLRSGFFKVIKKGFSCVHNKKGALIPLLAAFFIVHALIFRHPAAFFNSSHYMRIRASSALSASVFKTPLILTFFYSLQLKSCNID